MKRLISFILISILPLIILCAKPMDVDFDNPFDPNGDAYNSSLLNWTEYSDMGVQNWSGIASSSDGTKLAAAVDFGYIYTSTGIYISTGSGSDVLSWTEQTDAGMQYWSGIASSSDGTKLAACVNYGYIYTSDDSGATWTERTNSGQHYWTSITSSWYGTKLAACVDYGYIYTSDDSGATWTERTNSGQHYWTSITASSDGTLLIAGTQDGSISISYDSGATWTETGGPVIDGGLSVASSSMGTELAATSTGSGSSAIWTGDGTLSGSGSDILWTEQLGAKRRYWQVIAISGDGTVIAACESGGYIYISTKVSAR
jgi:hypothetical protein